MKNFSEKHRGLTAWFVYLLNMLLVSQLIALPILSMGASIETANAYGMALSSVLTLVYVIHKFKDTYQSALQKIKFPDVVLACSSGLAIRIVLTLLLFSVMTIPEPENQEVIQMMFENSTPLVMFFTVCIFAPIVEETLFRQVLIGDLEGRVPVWIMTIVSSVFFIMMHSGTDLKAGLLYATVTIPLVGVYRYYHNNVAMSISMHFVMNSLAFISMVAQSSM
ncbi:Membrane protease YdiL, CAAX protease family [Granulicatella balaenopterae]|uniref:Membrane protease YdiL, CAAX protease family n=1 Tax=Granulicatella balaenopterae TaxID=137733 RepID=A0A1H9JKZ5_9LACT|nr:CPBP family intramembrane glutamic endopeptidase [Granulicatella balaenopterae]SEQ87542.1 Membrane protease YdiL, CAAX protease family [Granulicatella balaenopterae]